MQRMIVFFCLFACCIMPLSSMTISAIAAGSANPVWAMSPTYTSCVNGDFLITDTTALSRPIGDGANESTTWTFDFTQHGNFASFSTSAPLTSALLTLTLTPATGLGTDVFWFDGYTNAGNPDIAHLNASSGTTTVQIQLLNYYTSAMILQAYTQGVLGKIPSGYADDATVSYARLDLVNAAPAVPEPHTMILVAAALLLCALRHK